MITLKRFLLILALPFVSSVSIAGDLYVDVEREISRINRFIIVQIEEGKVDSDFPKKIIYKGKLTADIAKYAGKDVCLIGNSGLKIGGKYFIGIYVNEEKEKKTSCENADQLYMGKDIVAFEVVVHAKEQYVKFDNINYIYPFMSSIINFSAPVSTDKKNGMIVSSLVPYETFYTYLDSRKKF